MISLLRGIIIYSEIDVRYSSPVVLCSLQIFTPGRKSFPDLRSLLQLCLQQAFSSVSEFIRFFKEENITRFLF